MPETIFHTVVAMDAVGGVVLSLLFLILMAGLWFGGYRPGDKKGEGRQPRGSLMSPAIS